MRPHTYLQILAVATHNHYKRILQRRQAEAQVGWRQRSKLQDSFALHVEPRPCLVLICDCSQPHSLVATGCHYRLRTCRLMGSRCSPHIPRSWDPSCIATALVGLTTSHHHAHHHHHQAPPLTLVIITTINSPTSSMGERGPAAAAALPGPHADARWGQLGKRDDKSERTHWLLSWQGSIAVVHGTAHQHYCSRSQTFLSQASRSPLNLEN